jgi:hypothetical protein
MWYVNFFFRFYGLMIDIDILPCCSSRVRLADQNAGLMIKQPVRLRKSAAVPVFERG